MGVETTKYALTQGRTIRILKSTFGVFSKTFLKGIKWLVCIFLCLGLLICKTEMCFILWNDSKNIFKIYFVKNQ